MRMNRPNLSRRGALLALAGAMLAVVPAFAQDAAGGDDPLARQRSSEAWVAGRFRQVTQVSPQEVDRLLRSGAAVRLLDVREADEFAVSRLRGAVRVSPDASAAQVRQALGPVGPGATIVLYCTIGFRSSRLAQRIAAAYPSADRVRVVNLQGGVIAWANAGLPFVDATGAPTRFVHPYDAQHAAMLLQPDRVAGTLHTGW